MSAEYYTIEPSGHNRWEVWHVGSRGRSWCQSFRWWWMARLNVRSRIAAKARAIERHRLTNERERSVVVQKYPIPTPE